MRLAGPYSNYAVAIASGLVFGAGLYVSQMIDPLKVLRFLNIGGFATGDWDPSLALVIVPAIAIMVAANRLHGARPLFANRFHMPALTRIDAPLIIGSGLFGIGWGMSGLCPGPAVALIAFGPENLLIFLATMAVGSALGGVFQPSERTQEATS